MAHYRKPKPINFSKQAVHDLAEEIAADLKYTIGSPIGPIIESLDGEIIEQNFWELPETNDGSIEIESDGSFKIFIPDYVTDLRKRFTVAHELGHFVLHYVLQDGPENEWRLRARRYTKGETDRTEWEANWFAAGFLMPKSKFKRTFRRLRGDVATISRKFGVSPDAVRFHALYHEFSVS